MSSANKKASSSVILQHTDILLEHLQMVKVKHLFPRIIFESNRSYFAVKAGEKAVCIACWAHSITGLDSEMPVRVAEVLCHSQWQKIHFVP